MVDKRLVPNAAEQAALAEMRTMREGGASLRTIGAAVGLPAVSVKRILDRVPA